MQFSRGEQSRRKEAVKIVPEYSISVFFPTVDRGSINSGYIIIMNYNVKADQR